MSIATLDIEKKKTLVPQLRFQGFEGEWKFNSIGNTCVVKTGGSDTQDRIDDGIYPFFVRSNTVERINTFSFDGEAILTSGDGVGVGKNFHYINGKFDYHQRVYALREFKRDYSGKFIYQVFKEQFYKRVIKLSAKNSVDSVRMSMITEMKISFPTLPEQQKIASFLSAVDEKTQQLSRKKELLEQYKKGVMQQLFSGKLRFKDENGKDYPDWEEKKLGDVADVSKLAGYEFTKHIVYEDKGEIIALRGLNIKNNKLDLKDVKYIDNSELSKLSRSKLYIDDLMFTYVGTIGEVALIKENDKYYLAPNVSRIRVNTKKIIPQYILQYFNLSKFRNNEIEKFISSSSQPALSMENIRKFKIPIPSIKEQQKIANFLSNIDTKIESVNQQLAQTQTFKKGLLQQMFA
jgi:type I restriction enzyme S subunit